MTTTRTSSGENRWTKSFTWQFIRKQNAARPSLPKWLSEFHLSPANDASINYAQPSTSLSVRSDRKACLCLSLYQHRK